MNNPRRRSFFFLKATVARAFYIPIYSYSMAKGRARTNLLVYGPRADREPPHNGAYTQLSQLTIHDKRKLRQFSQMLTALRSIIALIRESLGVEGLKFSFKSKRPFLYREDICLCS